MVPGASCVVTVRRIPSKLLAADAFNAQQRSTTMSGQRYKPITTELPSLGDSGNRPVMPV
jgi:hypothetical protein